MDERATTSEQGANPGDVEEQAPATTKGRRFWKLAGMTTRVAGRYAASRLRGLVRSGEEAEGLLAETHRASGRQIAETLGELKGAVMKVGQMASIGLDWLPRELAEPLTVLQRGARPVGFEVVAAQVEAELGARPEQLFERFDRRPFASASVGQVHRARTHDGREVVVKVQYPGVDRSIDSDLAQLKLALRAAGLLKLERRVANELFAELSRQLHEELDYTHEAENVGRFREMFANTPQVVVPEVVGELSTRRVLTLSYEPGTPLSDVTPETFDQRERDLIGRTLLRMIFDQVFTHGLVHADPNPANYAVRRGGVIVLYDFGCVKQLPQHAVEGFRLVFRGLVAADPDALERGLLELGARAPSKSVSWQQYRALLGIFRPLVAERPFDFGRGDIGAQLFALVSKDRSLIDGFQPPVQGVFVNRVLVGQHGTLRRMGARVDLRQLVAPLLA